MSDSASFTRDEITSIFRNALMVAQAYGLNEAPVYLESFLDSKFGTMKIPQHVLERFEEEKKKKSKAKKSSKR